jgi:isoquinoline 1-oxidoreductase alpha subunit
MQLLINGQRYSIDSPPDTPLLWVLRDELNLTGTKFGCGISACGACTVLVGGQPLRSCVVPVGTLKPENPIQTIEGVASADGKLHPVQKAWLDAAVPQCGYCQSGMVLSAVALLKQNPKPSKADIEASVTNLCRCGTYPRVVEAIEKVAGSGGKP